MYSRHEIEAEVHQQQSLNLIPTWMIMCPAGHLWLSEINMGFKERVNTVTILMPSLYRSTIRSYSSRAHLNSTFYWRKLNHGSLELLAWGYLTLSLLQNKGPWRPVITLEDGSPWWYNWIENKKKRNKERWIMVKITKRKVLKQDKKIPCCVVKM